MAMEIKDNKLFIYIADSDAIQNNRISFSNSTRSVTTNYCPPENREQKDLFYEFINAKLENGRYVVDQKPIVLLIDKLKTYKHTLEVKIKNKYSKMFNGQMSDLDDNFLKLVTTRNNIKISDGLFLSGERPYLQFVDSDLWKTFKAMLFGEVTTMVLEKEDDRFLIYPEFRPFLSKGQLDVEEESDNIVDDLIKAFDVWLKSYNNPKYRGIEKYDNYAKYLAKYIKIAHENRQLFIKDLSDVSLDNIDSILEVCESTEELKNLNTKIQSGTPICALKLYKLYLEYLGRGENSVESREFEYDSNIKDGKNIVVYGTPGCGKSKYVDDVLLNSYKKENVIRTTFYQDYSNADFVGQLLPNVKDDGSVSYEFMPGPFTLALEKAIVNPNLKVALVIEELNRGNAPSIFGDIFQLLDRDISGATCGRSTYNITNIPIQNYLKKAFEKQGYIVTSIMLPSNLTIIATMNTSDQNVFTLDTAFKRRWNCQKLKNMFNRNHPYQDYLVPGMNYTWKDFVCSINDFMINSTTIFNPEDKQLGVFFMTPNMLWGNGDTSEDKVELFAYKMLEYLWNDISKLDHSSLFESDILTLDQAIEKFITLSKTNESEKVFRAGIINKV